MTGAVSGPLTLSIGIANDVMPSFATVPTGWSVDRYLPAACSNIGLQHGQSNVLGILNNSTGDAANRGVQNDRFYNTQGEGYNISGGIGSVIQASLYLPATWASPSLARDNPDPPDPSDPSDPPVQPDPPEAQPSPPSPANRSAHPPSPSSAPPPTAPKPR